MPGVRILQSVAGEDFSWTPGQVVEMSSAQAAKWCDGYRAELVRGEIPDTPERGTPVAETPEAAAEAQTPERGEASPETTATRSRAGRTRKS